ncbi:hypothetical protein DFH06DRAFT_1160799 [Mycena polygramma]|nr:hypothetical protein DFH06DRAFT_1160799 [Mycena polygramma]
MGLMHTFQDYYLNPTMYPRDSRAPKGQSNCLQSPLVGNSTNAPSPSLGVPRVERSGDLDGHETPDVEPDSQHVHSPPHPPPYLVNLPHKSPKLILQHFLFISGGALQCTTANTRDAGKLKVQPWSEFGQSASSACNLALFPIIPRLMAFAMALPWRCHGSLTAALRQSLQLMHFPVSVGSRSRRVEPGRATRPCAGILVIECYEAGPSLVYKDWASHPMFSPSPRFVSSHTHCGCVPSPSPLERCNPTMPSHWLIPSQRLSRD